MDDIMKIVQALEDSNFLFMGVTETIKNETKEQKGGFLGTLLDTLESILLGNGKGIVRTGYGKEWDFYCHLIFKKLRNSKIFPRRA